jgi:hypothetical protein
MNAEANRITAALERRHAEMLRKAVGADGALDYGTLAEIQHLAKWRDAFREDRTAARRQLLLAVLAAVAVMVLVLATLARTPSTVAIDAKSSSVTFVLDRRQPVVPMLLVDSVSIDGAERLHIDEGITSTPTTLASEGGESQAIEVRRLEPDGTITLGRLEMAQGSRIALRGDATEFELQLRAEAAAFTIDLVAQGGTLEWRGGSRDLPRGTSTIIRADVGTHAPVILRLRLAKGREVAIDAAVSALSFLHESELATDAGTVTMRESTVESGTLTFLDVDRPPLAFRRHQRVDLDGVEGHVRATNPGTGTVAIEFDGSARDVQIGFRDETRSIMPSVLEWLRSRHGIVMWWTSTATLFALLLAWARWWRDPL